MDAAPETARASRLPALGAIGAWLVGMVAVGLPHAIWRHIHVDEAQVAYNTALWGVHYLDEYTNYAAPFMVPLAWLIGPLETSASMLLVLRSCFFVLFAASLVGVALAQPYFPGRAGRLAVLLGVTLFAPVWAHGFEIRHDAVVVAGSIVLYGLAQRIVHRGQADRWTMAAAGATSAAMLMVAYKGLLYAAPFGLVVLVAAAVIERRAPVRSRLGQLGWFAGGALAAACSCATLLAVSGHLDEYLAALARLGSAGQTHYRFSPAGELERVALGSPLVFGGAALFLVAGAVRAARRRRVSGADAITAAFLLWNLVALFLNPVPFPYNFLHLVPFGFLAALAALRMTVPERWMRVAAAAALLVSAALFARSWTQDRYLTRTSEAQLSYIRAAELMTDPTTDTVLDGAGMVLSRRPPGRDWMLHSLTMPDYLAGRRKSFGQMMIEEPSPVLLGSYRWGWLPRRDLALRQARYLQLYPELWVLGSLLAGPEGEVTIVRRGRYLVRPRDPREQLSPAVDGAAVPPGGAALLSPGRHRVSGGGASGLVVHWIGPHLDDPPAVIPLSPRGQMFTNE